MDGSTGNAGDLSTNDFTFEVGKLYTVDFDVSGNQRGGGADAVNLQISAGLASIGIFNIAWDYAWNTFSISFYGNGSTGALVFTDQGNDNVGVVLDNVRLSVEDDVPEPAALALIGLGLLGAGFASRRRRS